MERPDTFPVSPVGHDAAVTDLVDPGWKPALPSAVPFFGRIIARQLKPQILVMRALWISFASAIVWIGVVVVLIMSDVEATGSAVVGYVAVLVATVAGAAGSVWAARSRAGKDPASNDANAYRSYFFLRIAFSEVPALVGFAFCFVVSRPTPYYVGGPIALFGIALVAPTRRFLARQGPVLREAMLR
jgi:hypothetical protein